MTPFPFLLVGANHTEESIWSTTSGHLVARGFFPNAGIEGDESPSINVDGVSIAVPVNGDSPAGIYDLYTGALRRTLGRGRTVQVAFSPDGAQLAYSSGTQTKVIFANEKRHGSERWVDQSDPKNKK